MLAEGCHAEHACRVSAVLPASQTHAPQHRASPQPSSPPPPCRRLAYAVDRMHLFHSSARRWYGDEVEAAQRQLGEEQAARRRRRQQAEAARASRL